MLSQLCLLPLLSLAWSLPAQQPTAPADATAATPAEAKAAAPFTGPPAPAPFAMGLFPFAMAPGGGMWPRMSPPGAFPGMSAESVAQRMMQSTMMLGAMTGHDCCNCDSNEENYSVMPRFLQLESTQVPGFSPYAMGTRTLTCAPSPLPA